MTTYLVSAFTSLTILQHPYPYYNTLAPTMTHLDYFHYALDTMQHYNRRLYPSTFTRLGDRYCFISVSLTDATNELTLHALNRDLSINVLSTFQYIPVSSLSTALRENSFVTS